MSHTPIPWEAIPAKNEYDEATISIRGNGEFIATMDLVSVDGGPFTLPLKGEANAALIAAAPDLLSALEALASRFFRLENLYFEQTDNPPPASLAREHVRAKKAIAKAKGLDNV